ncbi:UvrD-helicase domain-containing protein [Halomicroarcula sp. GCM10025894]|uniref:UvrD-helicase domain-containing protein n=1 Tax=Halomicroarcula sp. GCM10025894 TaxID=3252673 RepID=UPI003614FC39
MTDSTTEVVRLFGGPGSGKTTALLDRVEELLEDETVDFRDVLVVSYTRAAAAEIRERLAERLDVTPGRCRGTSVRCTPRRTNCSISRGATWSARATKRTFATSSASSSRTSTRGHAGGRPARPRSATRLSRRASGSSAPAVTSLTGTTSRSSGTTRRSGSPEIDDNAQTGNKYTPTWPTDDDRVDVPAAIRGWRTYKGDNDLTGFADMLERVAQRSLLPNVDYLIIDEFQDITTLQYDVYEEWKPHMKRVLIAGDDDQVVYAWQGADPDLLLEEDVTTDEILPNSYRLPSRILNVVNREVRHIEKRQEKDLNPRKEGGRVEAVQNPSMFDLARNVIGTVDQADETVMVLFRARYQMFQFIDEFIDEGIPFSCLTDQRMWTDRLSQYVAAVEAVENDEPLSVLEARRLADMLADSAFGTGERDDFFDALEDIEEESEADDIAEIDIEPDVVTDHVPFVPDPASASDMLRKVTNFQERTVGAYFAGDYQGMDPNRVRLGTIHSAKGREADHVFVATDLTEKVVEQMAATVEQRGIEVPDVEEFTKHTSPVPTLTDNERRVFYVGMSRARERLVLMENLVDGAPTLPIDVLLENAPSERSIEELLDEAGEAVVAD